MDSHLRIHAREAHGNHVAYAGYIRGIEMLEIISGGQTGVDRGALDAALEAGNLCGGSCPEGRRAEDGVIPQRYPLSAIL